MQDLALRCRGLLPRAEGRLIAGQWFDSRGRTTYRLAADALEVTDE
jgi:hypothetical protein